MGAPALSDYLWPDVSQGRQPQFAAPIDWTNPLTQGLIFAYEGSQLHTNLVTGLSGNALLSGVATGFGPSGVERTFSGSQADQSCSFGPATWLSGATSVTWDFLVKVNSGNASFALAAQWDGINQNWLFSVGSGNLIWVACDDSDNNRTRFDLSGAFPTAGYYRVIASWLGGANKLLLINGVDKTSSLSVVSTSGNVMDGSFDNFQLGMRPGDTPLAGSIVYSRAWRRGLQLPEVRSLNDAPNQLFAPPVSIAFKAAAGGGGAALSASNVASTGSSAALSTAIVLAATAGAKPASSAALTTGISLVASNTASTASTAALTSTIALAASTKATTGSSAALSTSINLAASGAAVTASGAVLTASGAGLSASASASTSSSASLTTKIALAATGAATTASSAVLTANGQGLSASASATTGGSASLSTHIALTAAVIASPSASAALATQITLQASGAAQTSATATLTTGSAPWTASGSARTFGAADLSTQIVLTASNAAQTGGGAALTIGVTLFGAPMISTPTPRNWISSSPARNWTSSNAPRNWIASKD